jgi:hypothetical protein
LLQTTRADAVPAVAAKAPAAMHKAMAAVDKAFFAEIMCGFSNERK